MPCAICGRVSFGENRLCSGCVGVQAIQEELKLHPLSDWHELLTSRLIKDLARTLCALRRGVLQSLHEEERSVETEVRRCEEGKGVRRGDEAGRRSERAPEETVGVRGARSTGRGGERFLRTEETGRTEGRDRERSRLRRPDQGSPYSGSSGGRGPRGFKGK